MTEFEEQMLQESKKQTAHLSRIKANVTIILIVVSGLLGITFTSLFI